MDITDQDVLAVVWDAKNNIHAVVKELGMWEESMINDVMIMIGKHKNVLNFRHIRSYHVQCSL